MDLLIRDEIYTIDTFRQTTDIIKCTCALTKRKSLKTNIEFYLLQTKRYKLQHKLEIKN